MTMRQRRDAGEIGLDRIRGFHGGYWRYDFTDFHYLYNHYFPREKLYTLLKNELPLLMDNYPSTQRVIAGLLARWKNTPGFTEQNLIVANGSSELIRIMGSMIGKITVPIPTFNEYVELPKEKVNTFLLPEEDGFALPVAELLESIKNSRSDFAVICNPNNPVGDLVSRDDIELLLQSGVKLIVDEAFIDWSGAEHSCEDLVGLYDNLIIIKSLNKVAGTAGLRLGYMLTTNEEIRERVKKSLPIWNINSLCERFIELFPDFYDDFLDSLHRGKEDRRHLEEGLRDIPWLEPFPSWANFVFCKTGISAAGIGRCLFDNHKILIRDSLNQAQLRSDRYIRIGVRPRKDTDRLIAALREMPL